MAAPLPCWKEHCLRTWSWLVVESEKPRSITSHWQIQPTSTALFRVQLRARIRPTNRRGDLHWIRTDESKPWATISSKNRQQRHRRRQRVPHLLEQSQKQKLRPQRMHRACKQLQYQRQGQPKRNWEGNRKTSQRRLRASKPIQNLIWLIVIVIRRSKDTIPNSSKKREP